MKRKKIIIVSALFLILVGIIGTILFYKGALNPNQKFQVGQKLDSLNGVYVYYNGGVGNIEERNTSPDGYNIGLKYQCVEFVKRYYYEHYKHKMPDSYGNAKDFFDRNLRDGAWNKPRGLRQFSNPSKRKPNVGDLVIFDGHSGNPYGHVAIVSKVEGNEIEIIQQNPGPFAPSRVSFALVKKDSTWWIGLDRVLGRLSKEADEI